MTKLEVIEVLEVQKDHWERLLDNGICDVLEGGNTIQALKVAIRALKNEQSEQNVGMCQQDVGEMSEKQTYGDLIAEIDKLPRIKVGNSNSPTVKYCIDEVLLYDLLEHYKVEKTAEWIPVSSGNLPKEYKSVIVTTENWGVCPEARYSKEDGWEWAYEAGADYWAPIEDPVIAWMPLPEPYKENKEE